MAGRVKRAHASDLKLAEINDWKVTEPRSKKAKRRRVTLVEPEEIETDEGSEEEEEMEISPQPVEPFAGEQSIAVQVQARGPTVAASSVRSSSMSALLFGDDVALFQCRRGALRKAKNSSDEFRSSDSKPPEMEEELSECEEEDAITTFPTPKTVKGRRKVGA